MKRKVENLKNEDQILNSIFKDFKGRRTGLIKALTIDVEKLHQLSDPEKDNLCLFGFPNETWEVTTPVEDVPSDIPEPRLGINYIRDEMQRKEWLEELASHSDAWLVAVAFHLCSCNMLGKNKRERLFDMINSLPTLYQVLTDDMVKKMNNERELKANQNLVKALDQKPASTNVSESSEAEAESDSDSVCEMCMEEYVEDEFWIFCDICKKWFHGKCVNITSEEADEIDEYQCPDCTKKMLED